MGTHLSALDYHRMTDDPDTLLVDMQNHYEYEVNHFVNAHHANAGTFKEAIRKAADLLSEHKEKQILL